MISVIFVVVVCLVFVYGVEFLCAKPHGRTRPTDLVPPYLVDRFARLSPDDLAAMLASDHDRDRAVCVISAAMAEGRVGLEDGIDRIGRALASRTCGELAALQADLPLAPHWTTTPWQR